MRTKKILPVWRVFVGSFNDKKIIPYNIFAHGRFFEDMCKIVAEYKKYSNSPETILSGIPEKEYVHGKGVVTKYYTPDEYLSRKMRGIMMYYFWSKCEWETVITSWPNEDAFHKIDVFTQVRLNWDNFINYIKANVNNFPAPRNKDLIESMLNEYREAHKKEELDEYGI